MSELRIRDKVEVIAGHYKGLRGNISGRSYRRSWLHPEDLKYLDDTGITGPEACGWTVKPNEGMYNDRMVPRCMIRLLGEEESGDIKVQAYICLVCLDEGDIYDLPNGSCDRICKKDTSHIVCGQCTDEYYKVHGRVCLACTAEELEGFILVEPV